MTEPQMPQNPMMHMYMFATKEYREKHGGPMCPACSARDGRVRAHDYEEK